MMTILLSALDSIGVVGCVAVFFWQVKKHWASKSVVVAKPTPSPLELRLACYDRANILERELEMPESTWQTWWAGDDHEWDDIDHDGVKDLIVGLAKKAKNAIKPAVGLPNVYCRECGRMAIRLGAAEYHHSCECDSITSYISAASPSTPSVSAAAPRYEDMNTPHVMAESTPDYAKYVAWGLMSVSQAREYVSMDLFDDGRIVVAVNPDQSRTVVIKNDQGLPFHPSQGWVITNCDRDAERKTATYRIEQEIPAPAEKLYSEIMMSKEPTVHAYLEGTMPPRQRHLYGDQVALSDDLT